MAFVISASLGITLFASLFLTERRLSLFEMIIVWSFLQLVQNQYFWDLSLNMKLLQIANDAEKYTAFLFNHLITVPILTFYCLELAVSATVKWLKPVAVLLSSAVFWTMEAACRAFNVIEERPGFITGYAILFWTGIAILLYVLCLGLRSIAAKDVKG
ncbi:hypothetical protein D3P08_00710 [Paenibacillus nanensis]|uniref:Uncharacterized protein n=1 Tax=Paenibacillus nanensis TaxID=393251 RepID=A0A3A1VI65_9BACL|nr:hypothetical protein [Paenibacillus nanensis]RIX60141.1 hypothetical protein D3P08_00710 [Paenibacillus nanensis]